MATRNYLGFDLSTQQLKAIVITDHLELLHEAKVDFDIDLPHYGTNKGVLSNDAEQEIFSPIAMWLEALDLVLQRLKDEGCDLGTIRGLSGAGMQHGTVYWTSNAEHLLQHLDASQTLVEQLITATDDSKGAFSHDYGPNWQDSSTQEECEQFNAALGSSKDLAEVTGSSAHHRFSGPQILKFRRYHFEKYSKTARISLVSSFLASVLLGKVAPIDRSDVGGMNLDDMAEGSWNIELLQLVAGSESGIDELRNKLGVVVSDSGTHLGSISSYFVNKYGFSKTCIITPFTGDNPSTIIALPLKANEAIVSLGTSTTFLMSTSHYNPDASYHFMKHPTTAGLYMFMLCYKNGSLAREVIRDAVNQEFGETNKSWSHFNKLATSSPPLGQMRSFDDDIKLALYFSRPEIVPAVYAGTWRTTYSQSRKTLTLDTASTPADWAIPDGDVRTILESQFLSMRLRSQKLVTVPTNHPNLPPQPNRIYVVGGGSQNDAITKICGEVLGGAEGIYRLDIGGNACALGAAYKAVWAIQRNDENETFESFIGSRWQESGFVQKVADGYDSELYERYGQALEGFALLEQQVVELDGAGRGQEKECLVTV